MPQRVLITPATATIDQTKQREYHEKGIFDIGPNQVYEMKYKIHLCQSDGSVYCPKKIYPMRNSVIDIEHEINHYKRNKLQCPNSTISERLINLNRNK